LGIITIATFRASGGAQAAPGVSLADRIALPAHLLCVYFWKAVMPARLLPMYHDVTAPFMAAWIPVLAIGGLCLLLRWAPLLRLLLFGAAFSVVTLLPVLHLVHIQQQAKVFDHYTYLPGIGFALAVAAAVRAVVILRPALRPLFIAAMIVSCIGLAALSWRQCGIWRDNITLWIYVLRLRPECGEAFNNRGIARQQQKDWAGAVADYSAALSQGFFWAVLNRGTAYAEQGEYQRAIADADLALEVQPDLAAAWNNRADVCLKLKRYDEALSNADHAVALQPRRAVLHLTRAEILAAMGHHQHAIEAYDHALELEPENVNAVSGRTAVLQRQKL
jgi:cytochrome c-type biogenesis protein CcmH/NrfG